jgi:hypothetical protein
MTPDRLTWHLDNWAAWMSGKVDVGDYPSRSSSGLGHSSSRDFDALCAEADTRCAQAVDAVLNGMPPLLRLAVYNRHLGTIWELRCNGEAIYAQAVIVIERGLDRRGIF